ncbi:MAG TPA: hypothetical protein VN622_04445 [Clostridia bacterium]|nr:hypothetical protein [Clostridia bacterium]
MINIAPSTYKKDSPRMAALTIKAIPKMKKNAARSIPGKDLLLVLWQLASVLFIFGFSTYVAAS